MDMLEFNPQVNFIQKCSQWGEEIGAQASICTYTLICIRDCSCLFGTARAIQDLSICNTEFLFVEACQMSHLGQSWVKQSYESKR